MANFISGTSLNQNSDAFASREGKIYVTSYTTTNTYVVKQEINTEGLEAISVSVVVSGANAADFKVSATSEDLTTEYDASNATFVDEQERTSIGSSTKSTNKVITLYPKDDNISAIQVSLKSSVTDSAATTVVVTRAYAY